MRTERRSESPRATAREASRPQPKLILASASPRRRELLARLGVEFDVVVAEVQENEDARLDPRVMVAQNAALKADWVADRHPEAVVLGADTTVFIDGQTLNKPADLAQARAMLRRLSGRLHTVFTGVALRGRSRGLQLDGGAASDVTFRELTDGVIETYLRQVPVLDKAGAYGIQDRGEQLVAGYTGELDTIIGLPLGLTKQFLTQAGLWA